MSSWHHVMRFFSKTLLSNIKSVQSFEFIKIVPKPCLLYNVDMESIYWYSSIIMSSSTSGFNACHFILEWCILLWLRLGLIGWRSTLFSKAWKFEISEALNLHSGKVVYFLFKNYVFLKSSGAWRCLISVSLREMMSKSLQTKRDATTRMKVTGDDQFFYIRNTEGAC